MLRMLLSAVLLSAGLLVIWISVFGVFRFRFVMNRMQSAAIIDTLGLFLILAGLMVVSGELSVILKLILILGFVLGVLITVSEPDLQVLAQQLVQHHREQNHHQRIRE